METVSSDWKTSTTAFGATLAGNGNDFRTITQTVPAVGDMGDYYAVYMTNTAASKFNIPVVKAGTAMTARPIVDCDPKNTAAAALTTGSYKYQVKVGSAAWAQQSRDAVWSDLYSAIGTDW
jgi:hypothetical protein